VSASRGQCLKPGSSEPGFFWNAAFHVLNTIVDSGDACSHYLRDEQSLHRGFLERKSPSGEL